MFCGVATFEKFPGILPLPTRPGLESQVGLTMSESPSRAPAGVIPISHCVA